MFWHILGTFRKFAVVLIIFLCAFGFSFRMLVLNQTRFQSWYTGLLSTAVMMTGEMEYAGLLLSDNEEFTEQLHYPLLTVTIYLLFIIVMVIIVINLMTGLAIDDINQISKVADAKRAAIMIREDLQQFDLPDWKWFGKLRNKGNLSFYEFPLDDEIQKYKSGGFIYNIFTNRFSIDPNDYETAATDWSCFFF